MIFIDLEKTYNKMTIERRKGLGLPALKQPMIYIMESRMCEHKIKSHKIFILL
ncbi:hypothetical protein Lal_00042742 [Lupinus albus]|nr:hypothetical protein Lal_00042742 [Lupinus albus]